MISQLAQDIMHKNNCHADSNTNNIQTKNNIKIITTSIKCTRKGLHRKGRIFRSSSFFTCPTFSSLKPGRLSVGDTALRSAIDSSSSFYKNNIT